MPRPVVPAPVKSHTSPTLVDTGSVEGGEVRFPPWRGEADHPAEPPPAPLPPNQRVGFAVIGLGRLSLEQLLPAFGQCRKAKLVALVSGSPDKMKTVASQYGIEEDACLAYTDFETLQARPDVQAVYIVLPNSMHREYVERAAAIGKHVLCEKPLATSSEEARAMVTACERAGVTLMTAYRCQYEPYNLHARERVQERRHGRLIAMNAVNVQSAHDNAADQWRHKREMAGGGALPDIGLYCLNAARFISGEEPVEVFATMSSPPDDPRYADVEETVHFMLRFPSGFVAQAVTSYGAREYKAQTLMLEQATIDMPNAYEYAGQQMTVGHRQGSDRVDEQVVLTARNAFVAEIDHMADCVLNGQTPRSPGEEGVRDHVVMEAIYRSAATGRPVPLHDLT